MCDPRVPYIISTDFLMLLIVISDAHLNGYIFGPEVLTLNEQLVLNLKNILYTQSTKCADLTMYDCTRIKTNVFVFNRDSSLKRKKNNVEHTLRYLPQTGSSSKTQEKCPRQKLPGP